MAVAVKTSPGARPSSVLANPAILSLIGVVYLLGCLGIVFKLLPDIWWRVWGALGLERLVFVGGSALMLVGLAVGVGLLVLGARLLGPQPPAGVRAGVFIAFVGLLLVLVLTRWASLWLESWAYNARWLDPNTGFLVTSILGVVLLGGWLWLFLSNAVQQRVVRLEEAGWFHATTYKHNQGQKVRRATIFGILLLVGAGIWTLLSHGTLRRGEPHWGINIPFTGKVALETYGDAEPFIAKLPASAMNSVQVRHAGASNLRVRDTISFSDYQKAVKAILADPGFSPATVTELDKEEGDPLAYLKTINERIYAEMKKLLDLKVFNQEATRRLREVDARTDMADLTPLLEAFRREADLAKKSEELGREFKLPTAVLLVDRYALRTVNDQTAETANVIVRFKGDSKFEEGEVVSRSAFDEEVERLEEEKGKGRDRELPQRVALSPAGGPTVFASITLLPSVQFTVPLLLIAVSLWLAWRVVNMPTFADFLIATEAELNKVSWTTQKRLVQDTIVVLVTTLLMAVFLFGMDYTWKIVLSWKPIGVLHIPTEQTDENRSVEQKRW